MANLTRKQTLAIIEADAAENGQLSATGVRIYCENRISYQAMKDAVERGRKFGDFIRARDKVASNG